MKYKLIISMMLTSLSFAAQANNCGSPSMFLRGTHNGWTTQTPMVCNAQGKWQTTIKAAADGHFKFDVKGDWSENYGDNTAADASVDLAGKDIIISKAGFTGVEFDYGKKTYTVTRCSGGINTNTEPPFIRSNDFPALSVPLSCGTNGKWYKDIFMAATSFANPDTSSPWPTAIKDVRVFSDPATQRFAITRGPIEGDWTRISVQLSDTNDSWQTSFDDLDCAGLGLSLLAIDSTGAEKSIPMVCNAQTHKYTADYNPAANGKSPVRFKTGTGITFGDNLADGTLGVSELAIPVASASRVTVALSQKTYQLEPLSQPCGSASLAVLAPSATGKEQANPMTCGADNKWHFQLSAQAAVSFRLQDAQGTFWGDNQPDGKLDSSGNLILAEANMEVIVDYPAKTYQLKNANDWKRTVVFIFGQTSSGQDMFVRGGIDHAFAAASLGRNCTEENKLCAIPIKHRNVKNATTNPWKINDNFLDWYGTEANQNAVAVGSPMDWTTNLWPASWGAKRTYAVDGYGETSLNQWGAHYWILDVDMDCSKTVNGWFELKSFISGGPGWEGNVTQAGAPYVSKNHFAQCGKLNKFERNSNAVTIQNL